MPVIDLSGYVGSGLLPSPLPVNPALEALGPVDHSPPLALGGVAPTPIAAALTNNLPISEIPQALTMARMPTFFEDYYYRIHIRPARIDLGVVAAVQTREATLWNAFPSTPALLDAITFSQPGVEYTGDEPPVTMLPLALQTWGIVITTSGPPEIDAVVLFDFTGTADPAPIVVTGTRAIQFRFEPESPVVETWEWLTDIRVSVNGTEQRAGLRNVPRLNQRSSVIIESAEDVRELQSMLFSATNRFWTPQYPYATTVSIDAAAGASYLALNTVLADVRVDEFLMVITGGALPILVQALAVDPGGVTLAAPLGQDVRKGSIVIPGSPSFIDNNTAIQRYAVNTVARTDFDARLVTTRTSFVRPGHTAQLKEFDGMPVLEQRPLADELVQERYDANTQIIDTDVGVAELLTLWKTSKVVGARQYLVKRVQDPAQMDYWKLFGDTVRGSLKNFLLPSFRPDLVASPPLVQGAGSATFESSAYAEFYFKSEAKRYIAITSPLGVHYAKVLSAAKTTEGNSFVVFAPALPNVAGWEQASIISIMPAVRLVNDTIKLEHTPAHTILSFSFREAMP